MLKKILRFTRRNNSEQIKKKEEQIKKNNSEQIKKNNSEQIKKKEEQIKKNNSEQIKKKEEQIKKNTLEKTIKLINQSVDNYKGDKNFKKNIKLIHFTREIYNSIANAVEESANVMFKCVNDLNVGDVEKIVEEDGYTKVYIKKKKYDEIVELMDANLSNVFLPNGKKDIRDMLDVSSDDLLINYIEYNHLNYKITYDINEHNKSSSSNISISEPEKKRTIIKDETNITKSSI
jgi:exonuclease VII large subunit